MSEIVNIGIQFVQTDRSLLGGEKPGHLRSGFFVAKGGRNRVPPKDLLGTADGGAPRRTQRLGRKLGTLWCKMPSQEIICETDG